MIQISVTKSLTKTKKISGEQNIAVMDVDDESSVSVADHYRGTPPLRGKKKKPPYRNDKNLGDPVTSDEEAPPPLPPKKSHQIREASVDNSSYHSLAMDNDSIQSRPLPTPPTPVRSKKISPTQLEDTEVFHSLRSERSEKDETFHSLKNSSLTLVKSRQDEEHEDHAGDETLAESIIDSMHTCLDTVQSDGGDTDNTMHEHPQDADTDNTMDDHDHNISDDEVEFLEEMLPLDPRKDDESVTPTPPTL